MKRNRMFHTMANVFESSNIQAKPLVEIIGNNSALIENHCGVISYSPENITIKTRNGCIWIGGSGLTLAKMSFDQLRICGIIKKLELR